MEMSQYLEIFIEESKEHLQACNEKLLELEKNPDDLAIVNDIFRSAHTLKGMSATMGYEDLANLTHQMENVLDAIRNGKNSVTPALLDCVFAAVDLLEEMVYSIADGGDGKKDVEHVVSRLKAIEDGEEPSMEDKSGPSTGVDNKLGSYDDFQKTVILQSEEQGYHAFELTITLREGCMLKAVRAFMVFEILDQAGEIVKSVPSVDQLEEEKFDHEFSVAIVTKMTKEELENRILKVSEIDKAVALPIQLEKLAAEEEITNSRAQAAPAAEAVPVSAPEPGQKQKTGSKTIRVNIERLDILMNLFEELVIDRGRLETISKDLKNSELQETVERMTRISGDLQTIILNMRMVPIDTVFNRFPRMVRQLAKDLNKKIDLRITGAETELDRTVIDEIGDPLVHLIRNSMDHGIESPEARAAKGKPETGIVELKAYHSGNHVFIEVSDDGAGINREKVLKRAIDRGIVAEQNAAELTVRQINELIFAPGFSTADQISDISGRGVGLDVVKSAIESLGGSVTVDSEEGTGSVFSVQLPLTLSIISVLLVELEKEKYAIPISSVIETAVIRKDDIMHAHNQKVIDFRGKIVPLVYLNQIFDVPCEEEEDPEYLSMVVVKKGERLAGLVVNSFIGQLEVVLKPLGSYLNGVFAISGATILGDGEVALIIDCNALIK
ncbi:chemotaxis protein CheA [Bacillus sp. FJAT-42376]|uniref:chemotaxis protein CheA n=1 Tax=Bacillus sp. FJAT-42376 TaxID=2014076 RepID=UPI000F4D7E1E|nr:chemotaxis protein CheA [Bacillus sp. FJAT-42376]AZB42959.1 chemotaxis protein CheA [Bacillus sp. FJAT-42376]